MEKSIGLATSARSGALDDPSPSGAKGRSQFTHARLVIHEMQAAPDGTNAKRGEEQGEISFQFNPKEVTIQKSAKWDRKPATEAKKASPPQFTGSDPCKLTLEMFLDATGTHEASVVTTVEQLFACCVPSGEGPKAIPPMVELRWGQVASFPAYVSSVSAKYTLFTSEGIPIRALCSLSLEEVPVDQWWKQNPTSGGMSVRRAHRMVDGDTLASVAFTEYGDPTMWRPLAAFNGVDDPLRVPSGMQLLLPSVAELTGV